MTDRAATIRSWGIGLILIALILPVLGLFGEQFMAKRHNEVRVSRAGEAWEARRALLARHVEAMKSAFAELGEQPLREEWEMATVPVVELPGPVVAAAQHIVDSYMRDLRQEFPDVDQVTRIEFSFAASPAEVNPRYVTATSAGLPAEAALHPRRFELYSSDEGESVTIPLLLPEGQRPSIYQSAGQRWIENYSRAELLLDRVEEDEMIADNMLVGGVQVWAQLQSFAGEGAAVFVSYSALATVFNILGAIGLVLLVLIPPVWVYVDARTRRQPAVLWFLFTLPTSVLGALIYALVTRDAGRACPECGERVSPRYVVCPYCQTELKGTCPNCGQTVGHDWSYCPSCASEL